MRKFPILLALLAGAMIPLTAVAQDSAKSSKSSKKSKKGKNAAKVEEAPAQPEAPKVEFSAEQKLLNDQAFDATEAGEYKKAEQIFNAMLQIGEFNVIWLNLAKTYLMQDKCLETAEALEHVHTAPRISSVPHEAIEERASTYAQDMKAKCSSRVTVVCNPADTIITIDGGREMSCEGQTIALVPGRHVFYGQTSFGFNTVVSNTEANEETTVKVEVIDYEKVASDAGVTPEEIRKKSTLFKGLGYSFIGVGAAAIGAGAGLSGYYYFDYTKRYARNRENQEKEPPDKLREYRTKSQTMMDTGFGIIAVGGAMLVAGISLVVVDAVKFQPQIEMLESISSSNLEIAPSFSPEFTGLTLSGRF